MKRMVVVTKDVIDAWLRNKRVACYSGSEQFLAVASHIASQHDLPGYPPRLLAANMLPDSDVRVATPFESAHWGPEPEPAADLRRFYFTAALFVYCGFLLGVIAIGLVTLWT